MHPMLQKAIKYLPIVKDYLSSRRASSTANDNDNDNDKDKGNCTPEPSFKDMEYLRNHSNPLMREVGNNPAVFDNDYQITAHTSQLLIAKLLLDIRNLLEQQQQQNPKVPIPEINDVTAQIARIEAAVDASLESDKISAPGPMAAPVPVTPLPDKPQDEYR